MIDQVIERWHSHMRGELPGGLDELLDDDVVFYSPVVYTPQEGKFRYTKKVLAGDTAVLEFETTVGGKYVNGVDIIRCNDEGRIVEFRVMIRPLQAVNAVHQQMKAMLESMQSAD